MQNNKLFVGNLAFETTEGVLEEAFSAHGTVTDCHIVMDKLTGRPRGFAFVTMSTSDEAQSAIDALNGSDLDGRKIAVSVARPREGRPSGGGGFRGGGGGGYRGGGGGGAGYRGGGGRGGGGARGGGRGDRGSRRDFGGEREEY